MSCDIIIPVWNQLEVTKVCLESILKNTKCPYRLIIIDNASDKDTRAYLESLKGAGSMMLDVRDNRPEIFLIRNEINLGFVKAVNQGIRQSRGKYICIMNNDTIATDGWLKELLNVMESYPEIGLLNPSSNTSGQFRGKSESVEQYAKSLKGMTGQIQELYRCRGFCMLVRREVVDRLGPLDEIYHLGYYDDTDYSKMAQAAGFRTARAKGAYVYHAENVSFKELDDNNELFKKNEEIFFKRWGRPLRVGYFLYRSDSGEKVSDIAISVARSGHQISVFIKNGSEWPVRLDHFDIRRVGMSRKLFGIASVYKIVKRKAKKGFDVIATDDRSFGKWLCMTRVIHGSEVFVDPSKEEFLSALNDRSKLIQAVKK